METLPAELIQKIAHELLPLDYCNLKCVCKRFNENLTEKDDEIIKNNVFECQFMFNCACFDKDYKELNELKNSMSKEEFLCIIRYDNYFTIITTNFYKNKKSAKFLVSVGFNANDLWNLRMLLMRDLFDIYGELEQRRIKKISYNTLYLANRIKPFKNK